MFLTEEDVNKIIRTVRGITPEDSVLTFMKQYFRDKYDICILDYICSDEVFGPQGRKSKRVQFITWDMEEASKCHIDSDMSVRNNVKKVFARACQENDLHPDFQDLSNFFSILTDIESDITEFFSGRREIRLIRHLKAIPRSGSKCIQHPVSMCSMKRMKI